MRPAGAHERLTSRRHAPQPHLLAQLPSTVNVSDTDIPRHQGDGAADRAGAASASAGAAPPDRCAGCRRSFEPDESTLVLMRDGRPVASYHERCHPHYRRGGCSAC
ncbi:MAG TPA: hypothetical protein VFJ74_15635 [Gemmatimonadaceae bacterium]|nr:hypothetical protein [Gemmatimonadaceae bacterium]